MIRRWLRRLRGSQNAADRERSPTDPWDRAYVRWRSAPFPAGHHIDAIDEMKAQLVYLDYLVADEAIPLDEDQPVIHRAVNVGAELAKFRSEVETLLGEAGEAGEAGEVHERLAEYLHYCELLETMNGLVEDRIGPVGNQTPADGQA